MGKKGSGRVRVKQVQPSAPKNPLAGLSQGLEEIKLPPKPDPSISFPWPSHDFSVLQDCNTFKTIYPSYLDSTKTIKLGRRIAASDGQERPTVAEIGEALQSLNLRHVIEPHKGYSRDEESRWDNPGRVLVDMTTHKRRVLVDLATQDESDAVEQKTWSKLDLLREISKRVPASPSRLRRIEEEKAAKAAKAKAIKGGSGGGGGGGPGTGSGGGGGGGSSSKKKKGKKRR